MKRIGIPHDGNIFDASARRNASVCCLRVSRTRTVLFLTLLRTARKSSFHGSAWSSFRRHQLSCSPHVLHRLLWRKEKENHVANWLDSQRPSRVCWQMICDFVNQLTELPWMTCVWTASCQLFVRIPSKHQTLNLMEISDLFFFQKCLVLSKRVLHKDEKMLL